MPVVRFPVAELERLLGRKVPHDELARDIPMLGADVDDVSGPTWAIEFFPDRPDLYTVEGIARALRAWYGVAPGLARYDVAPARHEVRVDASVEKVRPFIAAAFVRGVDVTKERLDALIALQEDLHWGLGARRRKVAIGVHDAARLAPPFAYAAVGLDSVRFVPLASETEMTPREILAKHEKGVAYAHLLKDAPAAPLITDAKGQVLSMPPIINGRLTTVTTSSRDLFLDVTGTDRVAVKKALNLLATSLAEAGGKLEAVKIGADTTPDLAPEKRRLDTAAVNRFLGTTFADAEVAAKLERTGHGARPAAPGLVEVLVPAYRADVMHDVDVMEDVAIGHGFNAFTPARPGQVTYGQAHAGALVAERARRALVGHGFLEAMTLSLTNDADQFDLMQRPRAEVVRVKNPVSEGHEFLRPAILPNLLGILRRNAHRDYPQRVFEVGMATVAHGSAEPKVERRVAGVVAHAKAGFSEVKGLALALQRDMGWTGAVVADDDPSYVRGRVARFDVDGAGAGRFGELAPAVVTGFGLAVPVIAFEFTLG